MRGSNFRTIPEKAVRSVPAGALFVLPFIYKTEALVPSMLTTSNNTPDAQLSISAAVTIRLPGRALYKSIWLRRAKSRSKILMYAINRI